MSALKRRSLIIAIITFISVIIFSQVLVLLLGIKKHKQQDVINAEDLDVFYFEGDNYPEPITLPDGTLTNEYWEAEEFYIMDGEGMSTFFTFAWDAEKWGASSVFKDKVVKLGKDIVMEDLRDMSTTSILPEFFHGTFDGQGHSLTLKLSLSQYHSGIFSMALPKDGVIKNTRFLNCYGFAKSYPLYHETRIAVITGTNYGTIENCIVENVEFKSNRHRDVCSVAPLVVDNQGKIQYCEVKGYYKIGSTGSSYIETTGIQAYPLVISGNNPTQSVVYFHKSITSGPADLEYHIKYYNPGALEGSLYNTNREDDFVKLNNISSVGGSNTDENGFWYYAKEYILSPETHAWPMLRYFMDWQTIVFEASSHGEVNPETILIPADINDLKSYYGSVENIEIYSQQVEAIPDAYYRVVKWDLKDNTYWVYFSMEAAIISFALGGEKSKVVMEGSSTYYLNLDSIVEVDVEYYDQTTSLVYTEISPGFYDYERVPCVRFISYTFYAIYIIGKDEADKNIYGNPTKTTVSFYEEYDKYNPDYVSKYFLSQQNVKYLNDFSAEKSNIIIISALLKNYNVTFG